MNRIPLICPISGLSLRAADDSLFEETIQFLENNSQLAGNEAITLNQLTGLLITEDQKRAYPIRAGIPRILSQLAISLEPLRMVNSVE